MASAFLEQALEALRDSASSDALYVETPDYYDGSMLRPLQRRLTAHNRRLRFLRNSVLFSAISAEAAANEFIFACLNVADRADLDRLPTIEKLVEAPRRAGYAGELKRGAAPLQTLKGLSKARDRLVHPKPGDVVAYISPHTDLESDQPIYGPRAGARYIVAVAHAMRLLRPLRPDRYLDAPAPLIWENRQVLEEHVRLTGEAIGDVPSADAPPVRDLQQQMRDRVGRKRRRLPQRPLAPPS